MDDREHSIFCTRDSDTTDTTCAPPASDYVETVNRGPVVALGEEVCCFQRFDRPGNVLTEENSTPNDQSLSKVTRWTFVSLCNFS